MLDAQNFKISHGLFPSYSTETITSFVLPAFTHSFKKDLYVDRVYFPAMYSEKVMTANEHARQMQTSENRAIVWMRANRDAFTGLGFGSFSSGIKRARCWSLNWPLFKAQKNTTRLIKKPADM
jgi:hypothetical protein